MVKKYNNFLQIILFFVFSFASSSIYAQCAGSDNVTPFDVCDIPAASSASINLFALLGGSPVAGGVWTDDFDSGGLDTTTGILNAQLIRASGTYNYTYTVSGISGCTDNSSTVTVIIGGYSGVTSPNVSVCSAVENFSLFQAFNGVALSPQSNGQWHDDILNKNVPSTINVKNLEGTFQFTYTMPAIGSCPAMSSTAIVTVFRAPEAGTGKGLNLCANDGGLSSYTNYDLFNSISGQDAGGTWVDASGTGELTYLGDHFIDIQKIYNSYGAGNYIFNYRVPSTNPICPTDVTSIRITIEEKLDFTGAKLDVRSDICESEIATANYSATITRGPASIPNGNYRIRFRVTGPRAATETIDAVFVNGILSFPIKPEYFQRVGTFTITILNIFKTDAYQACENILDDLHRDLNIYALPDLSGSVITPGRTCQNEDATLKITNAAKLVNGTYDIIYNVRGANIANSQIARVTAVGGVINDFVVPGILNSKSGTSTIHITAITQVGGAGCVNAADVSGEIVIDPLPSAVGLKLQITNVCLGSPVTVAVSGLGTLTDVTLSYLLSGSNTSTVQTVVLSSVVNGNASFQLPQALLVNSGSTTISVTNLKNNITTCADGVSGIFTPFTLFAIPAAPTVVSPQAFCKVDNATIANLKPHGPQYKWYASPTSTTPLADTYALQAENYYVTVTTQGCPSQASMVSVVINDTDAPELNIDGEKFCGSDNPTISDLSNKTNSPSTVVWYDARNNGKLLAASTPLVDKAVYYGFDISTSTNCISYEALPVTVSLTDCNSPEYPFFIPDGFSPNGDGVNDVYIIPNIDFLYPDYTIEIFNRYGNGMYKGHKNKPGWDGLNYETEGISHGIAPNGVYFYIINFNKDNKPPKQGRIYLNR